jgi:hypothetical protein
MHAEELTPCQRCGSPTPLGVSYCTPCRTLLLKDQPMKTYICKFSARTRGALGVPQQWTREVQAEDEEAARLKLYDDFDHMSGFKAVEKPAATTEPNA